MENQILQAVIKSLKTYPEVKNRDIVVLGNVNTFSNDHVSGEQLINELSDYIELGYFTINDGNIRVTELGIDKLELNS